MDKRPIRTIKPPAGKSRISLEDAIAAARFVYRDKSTGRLVVVDKDSEKSYVASRRRSAKK